MAGQQHAQLFKALADGSDGLGQVLVALRGAAVGGGVRLRIQWVDAPTRKHIGPGCKAGLA